MQLKPFYDSYSRKLEDEQINSLKRSISGAQGSLTRLSKEIEEFEKLYNQISKRLTDLENEKDPFTLVEDEMWGDFYGIYCRVAEALKAAQQKSGDNEDANALVTELYKYASKMSLSIVDGKIQVCMNVGFSIKEFEKKMDNDKNLIISFKWDNITIPTIFSLKKPSISYFVYVFDTKKNNWTELSSLSTWCYELKNFNFKENYKFKMMFKIKFFDDPKTYSIFTEECEYKFDEPPVNLTELKKVIIKEYDVKPREKPPTNEQSKKGKEYDDISSFTFTTSPYKGHLRKVKNCSIENNGTVYVKTGCDGWNGFCLGDTVISKSSNTRWFIHVVKTGASWCILGVVAEDYEKKYNSMWGISFHDSSIVTGSPLHINNKKKISNRFPFGDGSVFCFEVNPIERKLMMSTEDNFNKFYVLAEDLPMDRNLVPLIMAFNEDDTIELLESLPEKYDGDENDRSDSSGEDYDKMGFSHLLPRLSKGPSEMSSFVRSIGSNPGSNSSLNNGSNSRNSQEDGNEGSKKKGIECKLQ